MFLYLRNIKKSEDDIPVPPLIKSAAVWGMHCFVALLFVSNKSETKISFNQSFLAAYAKLLCFPPPLCRSFSGRVFQHPVSDNQRVGTRSGSFSTGEAASAHCNGVYSWRAICQQCLWRDAVRGLG